MPQFLKRDNAPDLAYESLEAQENAKNLPTVMFLGGFQSDMEGTKALFLEEKCKARGQAFVRFDYRGHGKSEGKFEDSCISEWAQDARDILENCTKGFVILVGSSMGGWISLLLALQKPERIYAFVGVAAAPDFTKIMEERMSDEQRQALQSDGFFELPNEYDSPYIITKKLIDDGRENGLLEGEIKIDIPVRLIQGKADADVAWQTAERIKEVITGNNVEVILLKDADHRLSSPEQLVILNQAIEGLL